MKSSGFSKYDRIETTQSIYCYPETDILINKANIRDVKSELNMIHPFREENGRAIREFIRCLALKAGYDIDWSLVDSKELLDVTIIAVDRNLEPLIKCLYRAIIIK